MIPEKIYTKTGDIIFREIAGEAILVPIKRSSADLEKIYTLNSSAACIWQMIDGSNTTTAICNKLVDEFDIDQTTAEKDLDEFLKLLLENKMIKES